MHEDFFFLNLFIFEDVDEDDMNEKLSLWCGHKTFPYKIKWHWEIIYFPGKISIDFKISNFSNDDIVEII